MKTIYGSLAAVVHGNTVERLSYDPWGRRRNTTNFGYDNVSHTFDRGYTLHEHYDGFDLINMKFTLSERSAKLCLSTAERCELGGANGRLYDPVLGRMLSPDIVVQDEQNSQAYNRYSYCFNNPLRFTDPSGYVVRGSRNYYDWNSMVYYDFGNHRNNGSAFNTDLSEGKFSPIYDVNGYFLGTDDEGLQGEAIVMRREDFRQGMSHEDALAVATELDANNKDAEIRLYSHFSQLRNRPDWDGVITDLEAREWWRNGNGHTLYVNQSAINLSPLSIKAFGENCSITHNFFFDRGSDKDIGRVYGTLTLHLINPNTGEVKLGNINTAYIDTYDFNLGGSLLRNMATWGAKNVVGDGTPFKIYGWGDNPKVKLIWKQ